MKLRYILLVLLTTVFIASCGKDNPSSPDPPEEEVASEEIGSDGGEITSPDGNLTLTFPEGALSGTETITIGELSEDDLGSEFDTIIDSLGIGGVYELGPDGLQFDEPVTATIASDQSVALNDSTLELSIRRLMFISSDGQGELLDSLRIEPVSEDSDEMQLSGELNHFSDFVEAVGESGLLTVRVEGVSDQVLVDEVVNVDVRATVDFFASAEVSYSAWSAVNPDYFLPTPDMGASPFSLPETSEGTYGRSIEYVCEDVGPGIFKPLVTAEIPGQSSDLRGELHVELNKDVECVEEISSPSRPEITNFGAEPTGLTSVEYELGLNYTGSLGSLDLEIDYGDDNTANINNDDLEETSEGSHEGSWEYDYGTTGDYMPEITATNNETGESDTESGELQEVNLTVNKDGDGTGTVTGTTPDGPPFGAFEVINCGSKCSQPYFFDPVFLASAIPTELTAEPTDGSVFAGWSGDIDGQGDDCQQSPPEGGTCTVTMNQPRTITATFEKEEPEAILPIGVFTPPSELVLLEAFFLLFHADLFLPPNKASLPNRFIQQSQVEETQFGELSGTFPVAFSGSGKVVVVDLLTDELLMEIDASSISPVYGVAGVATEPAHESAAFVIYGAGGNGEINSEGGGFFSTNLGASYDAVPAGGNVFAGAYILTGGSVMLQTYDSEFGYYSFPDGHVHVYGGEFDDDGEWPVSAWVPNRPEDNWPATIAVTQSEEGLGSQSSLYLVNTKGSYASGILELNEPPVKVADLGLDARKVRCTPIEESSNNLICGVTVFGEDRLALYTWDGETEPITAGTVDVGDGPVNLDLRPLPNGNIGLVTSGFNDDTITEIELATDGGVISNNTRSVSTECESPGHAKFIRDAESLKLIGTCYDSANYFIMESEL